MFYGTSFKKEILSRAVKVKRNVIRSWKWLSSKRVGLLVKAVEENPEKGGKDRDCEKNWIEIKTARRQFAKGWGRTLRTPGRKGSSVMEA